MTRHADLWLTALAPAVWGSTYYVTSEWLPDVHPLTLAMLRALPAGLLLLALVRQLPPRRHLGRILLLGTLNFAVFWSLLFAAAQRLPGGVAATLGSSQALLVLLLAKGWLGTPLHRTAVAAAVAGVAGVGLLVLGPSAALDPLGLAAGIGSAAAMAAGTVLSRKWQWGAPPLTFTAWQLAAGGLVLLPLAALMAPAAPTLRPAHVGGLLYLGVVGAAVTYFLWFRGIARLGPGPVSLLALLSPMVAVGIGWALLDQSLTPVQMLGALVVLGSVAAGQASPAPSPSAGSPRAPTAPGRAPERSARAAHRVTGP
jgi:probable blue pigment (indigoidine) exporter